MHRKCYYRPAYRSVKTIIADIERAMSLVSEGSLAWQQHQRALDYWKSRQKTRTASREF